MLRRFFLAALSSFTFFQPLNAQTNYLQDLEEYGYCVIPEVFSEPETKHLYERVWHEYIEKAWPNCKMDDRGNWQRTFPIHSYMGILSGPAGQTQVMWDLRQDKRIVDIFAKIWNCDKLIVSMDGMSLMCPPEIREGHIEPWPHVDQSTLRRLDGKEHSNSPPVGFISESSLITAPYTIQGQFLFEDSSDGDGGFYCIPKSHLRFDEFAPLLEAIAKMDTTKSESKKLRAQLIHDFFYNGIDANGNPYVAKHVTAPKGSLILWDSRTLHWNQHASKDRAQIDLPKVRMVGYLCYVPKARMTEESLKLRLSAFENGVATGHNPNNPEHKYTKDHIYPEFAHFIEDAGYTQPQITLSALGKSLLGL